MGLFLCHWAFWELRLTQWTPAVPPGRTLQALKAVVHAYWSWSRGGKTWVKLRREAGEEPVINEQVREVREDTGTLTSLGLLKTRLWNTCIHLLPSVIANLQDGTSYYQHSVSSSTFCQGWSEWLTEWRSEALLFLRLVCNRCCSFHLLLDDSFWGNPAAMLGTAPCGESLLVTVLQMQNCTSAPCQRTCTLVQLLVPCWTINGY